MGYDEYGNYIGGYNGNSMSNRAVRAYEFGMMPLSKWNKTNILARMEEFGVPPEKIALASKLSLEILKKNALKIEEWHHTSGAYNITDFYDIDEDWCENLTQEEVSRLLNERKISKKNIQEPPSEERWLAEWEESHKKGRRWVYETYASEGIKKGDWFYLPNGTKKAINGRHFTLVKRLDNKKPRKMKR